MSLINKRSLICLVFLLFPAVSGAGQEFSLEKSIEYGLEHSPTLQGGDIKVEQADMTIKAQRGLFLPSVTAGFSHSKISSISSEGPTDTDYLDQKNDVASLRLTQTLFAGFENRNRFQRAKLGKEYDQAQLEVQKLGLIFQIKATFFELLKKRYDLSSITQQIKRLEADLAEARALSDKKIAPYVYVLQAEANLEDSRQAFWQAETSVYQLDAALKRLIGLPLDHGIRFDDDFDGPQKNWDLDMDVCIDQALANRPEIGLLRLQVQMAEKDVSIANGRYYPRVSLDVSRYDSDKKYDNRSSSDQENEYWNFGISVQWKFFDGGTAFYEGKRGRLEIKRLETQIKQATMEIKEDVSVSYHMLREAKKRLVSVEKALAASNENYTRQKRRFKARIGKTSEVLDAQALLARAESGKSQALLDYQMSLVKLYHAMGMSFTTN